MTQPPKRNVAVFDSKPKIEKVEFSNRASSHIGCFQPDVLSFTPGNNIGIVGKILPCFDFGIELHDTEFKKGYISYRELENEISRFFLEAPCHSFFGNNKLKFFSPKIYHAHVLADHYGFERPPNRDPIDDVHDFVKSSARDRYGYLLPGTSNWGKPTLKSAESRLFLNVYGRKSNDRVFSNMIIDLSALAKTDLVEKLDALKPEGVESWDPNYPYYLFGDVTDPTRGAIFHTGKIKRPGPARTYEFNGIIFNDDNEQDNTRGMKEYNTLQFLEGRVNMWSTDPTYNPMIVMSYQDIVHIMVEDGFIPVELIKEACSDYADVGATTRGPIPPAAKPQPPPHQASPAVAHTPRPAASAPPPPPPPPPPAPPPPPPVEAVKELEYYCSVPGVFSVEMLPESKIQDLLDAGHLVQVNKDGRWVTTDNLDVLGFRLPRKHTPPPPPPPPDKPAPPPPPPPPREEAPPRMDGYVPPKISSTAPTPTPVEATTTSPAAGSPDPRLTPRELELLKKGWNMYKTSKNPVIEATPDFTPMDVVESLDLMGKYDEHGVPLNQPF
jgi:hypothetical protein